MVPCGHCGQIGLVTSPILLKEGATNHYDRQWKIMCRNPMIWLRSILVVLISSILVIFADPLEHLGIHCIISIQCGWYFWQLIVYQTYVHIFTLVSIINMWLLNAHIYMETKPVLLKWWMMHFTSYLKMKVLYKFPISWCYTTVTFSCFVVHLYLCKAILYIASSDFVMSQVSSLLL